MQPGPKLESKIEQARIHLRAGRLAKAESLYRRLLTQDPRQPNALIGLSEVALRSQRNLLAVELLGRVLEVQPDDPRHHANLGEAYRRLGQRRDAANSLLSALALNPNFAEGFYKLAWVLQDNGETAGALIYFERAADLESDNFTFQQSLASGLSQIGEHARAAGHYACAWLLGGRDKPVLDALANTLSLFGKSDTPVTLTAESAYQQALALERLGDLPGALTHQEFAAFTEPNELRYQKSLAGTLQELGAFARAVAHYHCTLALDPSSVETLLSLSAVLKELGRSEGAAAASERALGIDPNNALAHASLAAARVDQRRNEEAIASCKRAIEIDSSVWLAHFQLGNALVGCGEVEAALGCYRRTIALCPTHHVAHSNLVFLMSYVPGFSAATIGEEARAWARQRAEPLAREITTHANARSPDRRLRIGYVSPDFRDHPVASFVLPLLENHDRAGYEAICYASVHQPDSVTKRLSAAADGWRDIAGAGDPAVADLVRRDGIDVLVDLAMHSGGGRPRLFARKPAPVQICWLAYVGTTGLSTMDYRITDPYLGPPGIDPGWCTETPLQLPETFWCYRPLEPALKVNALPALSTGRLTFGSQHSFHKIHRGVILLWARVLRAVEGSRLLLYAPASSHGVILDTFESERVDAKRIEFLPLRSRSEYLAAYHRIDISLDTFPYNGATTSLDAWYMGVPVVSFLGQTPVGRAGHSIATNLGLPEFVAASENDYVKVVIDQLRDLGRLSGLRANLRDRMQGSPLMDAARFTRNLERAYRYAWTTWCGRDNPVELPIVGGTE